MSDLIESMRAAGYFNLDDVYYGLYEANGSFSALEKEEKTSSLAVTLIDSGKLNAHNLSTCGIERAALDKFLKEQRAKINKVLVMTVDGNGRVYFQKRGESYKILQMAVNGQW